MNVAIYCRVSTEGQEQDGTSLKTQLEACVKYCKTKGYDVVCQYAEAWSGLSPERPRLAELREVVRSQRIDSVVFYSLDSLIQTKENITKLVDMEVNLKELCARIVPDLENCTNSDKKEAYTYLDLKVKATPEGADIKGFLDPSVLSSSSCLLTTGQTSG